MPDTFFGEKSLEKGRKRKQKGKLRKKHTSTGVGNCPILGILDITL
jgi:hypothetical protein